MTASSRSRWMAAPALATRTGLGLWLALSGCVSWDPDFDHDGHLPPAFGGDDCANRDETIPGVELCTDADEVPVDEDCDGLVDEPEAANASIWYLDRDADGFGDRGAEPTPACEAPDGYVADHSDCDDLSVDVHPGVDDLCDGVDQDCDGNKDEDAQQFLWYADADDDGFGAPGTPVIDCRVPAGHADNDDDCDDTSEVSNPSKPELCDAADNNCDGAIDEGLPKTDWHPDADADGFGDPDADFVVVACPRPAGFTVDATDCDDGAPDVSPAADEVWYDDVDQDCDAASDYDADLDGFDSTAETLADGLPEGDDCDDTDADVSPDADEVWYDDVDGDCDGGSDHDQDGDGYEALAAGGTDCDDTDAAVRPGATEIYYDGTDQDCDGASDYDRDIDGIDSDAYGGEDCDDTNAATYPGATEIYYNGADNNCDGSSVTDDYDADGDGYTSDAYSVGDRGDCDDTSSDTSPGIDEDWYNGVDNDCDGSSVEEDYDADLDGYVAEGTPSAVIKLLGKDDCDDTDDASYPDNDEVWRNGVDNDCSGDTPEEDYDEDGDGHTDDDIPSALVDAYPDDDCDDEDALAYYGAAEIWYNGDDNDCKSARVEEDYDQDGDLHLSLAKTPSGVADRYPLDDCDDLAKTVYKGASETVADAIDQDCDTFDTCYEDLDKDTYGTAVRVVGMDLTCANAGESTRSTDCDDASAADNPGAAEIVGNSDDDDCDTKEKCYADTDADGYGSATLVTSTDTDCADSGEADDDDDCDDAAKSHFPGAAETIANAVDEDCDGVDACYEDLDGDSYGTAAVIDGKDLTCANAGESKVKTDCDDASATDYVGATELVNNADDDDCDSFELCYADRDRDTYGTSTTISSSDLDCADAGEAINTTDCDDTDVGDYPGAAETVANADDEDCDGVDSCYQDNDGDTYGTAVIIDGVDLTCAKSGEAKVKSDCDDLSAADYPGATEVVANGDDDDCDSFEVCYKDSDGDAYGTPSTVSSTDLDCVDSGEALVFTDCDDTDPGDYPGATETVANGDDEDCDAVDSCYQDGDKDGYGTPVIIDGKDLSCTTTDGESAFSTDCDDLSAADYPGATEVVANGDDDDCDSFEKCYKDVDNDTYGATTTVSSTDLDCADLGEADDALDCDDADAGDYPFATEIVANGDDEDCDTVDACYQDSDKDGYGTAVIIDAKDLSCTTADGESAFSTDCDDLSPSDYPGATEVVANGDDDDCDTFEVCYKDVDNDTYGSTSTASSTDLDCADLGEADDDDDCDDGDSGDYPFATEVVANGDDEDCDTVDACYQDGDKDGYGTAVIIDGKDLSCDTADKESAVSTDCDDLSASDNPGATEVVANGDDDDCDTFEKCYIDADADGYGTTSTASSTDLDCVDSGEASVSTDCDDTEAADYPGAAEIVANGDDEDCDGVDSCYQDADKDGYGTTSIIDGKDLSCTKTDGESAVSTDCLDTSAVSYPGATEGYDGLDNNCDGYGTGEYDYDQDRDGYIETTEATADGATASVLENDDCDDTDATINPFAWDVYDGSTDDDCDTKTDAMWVAYAISTTPYVTPDRGVQAVSAASANPFTAIGATDLDLDGGLDLAAGVWLEDIVSTSTLTDAGAVYVGYGDTTLFTGGLQLAGASAGDAAGRSLALPGDINADAKGSDLLVGIPGYDTTLSNAGAVCLVAASTTLTAGTLKSGVGGRCTWLWVGSAANEAAGTSLASLGSFNAGAAPDFAVGAPAASPSGKSGAGRVYLVLGGSGGTSTALTSTFATLNGATAGDAFGTALTGLRDFDEDGRREVAIGAPGYDGSSATDAGAVYVYQTSGTGTTAPTSAAYTLTGGAAGDNFGAALASGDVDGDGYGDLVVGAPGYDLGALSTEVAAGAVYLYLGTSVTTTTSSLTTADATWRGVSGSDALGTSLDVVGDVDGDGYEDLVIGAPKADYTPASGTTYTSAGASYLVFGGTSWSTTATTITSAATTFYYTAGDHGVGTTVSRAGDYDDDGYDDFLIGRATQTFYLWNGRP